MPDWFKLTAACVFGALVAATPLVPASAQTLSYQMDELRRNTPSCRDNPDFPWEGRVSGDRQTDTRTRPVSFAGCFPNQASCEAWRREAISFVTGRIIYDSCYPRR